MRFLFPIRKVVSHTSEGGNRDVLECGHMLPEASDMFGKLSPNKRHCRECWAALSEEEKQKRIKDYEDRKKKRKDKEHEAWQKWSARRQ